MMEQFSSQIDRIKPLAISLMRKASVCRVTIESTHPRSETLTTAAVRFLERAARHPVYLLCGVSWGGWLACWMGGGGTEQS